MSATIIILPVVAIAETRQRRVARGVPCPRCFDMRFVTFGRMSEAQQRWAPAEAVLPSAVSGLRRHRGADPVPGGRSSWTNRVGEALQMMSLHSFIYQRLRAYRRAHAQRVLFGLLRLNGFSRTEAAVSMLAHKICGTPMYYHPKRRRAEIKAQRELVPASGFEPPASAV
jgi:hypothetical protein